MTATASLRKEPLVDGEFPMLEEDFAAIASLVYAEAGIRMGEGKTSLVYSRLARRLRALGLSTFSQYVSMVTAKGNEAERGRMIDALTTNFTRFFREEHHFRHLQAVALPPLVDAVRRGARLRIWSAGCSNGQEPYTIAMSLLGLMPDAAALDVRILASDINADVLGQAEAGVYDEAALADVPAALRERWFERSGTRFRVRDEVRALVAFRQLNLMQPSWPMRGRFDVVFCRNVAIYFDEQTQERLWPRFAQVLVPGGYLYIGHSERIGGPAAPSFAGAGVTTYRHVGGARQ